MPSASDYFAGLGRARGVGTDTSSPVYMTMDDQGGLLLIPYAGSGSNLVSTLSPPVHRIVVAEDRVNRKALCFPISWDWRPLPIGIKACVLLPFLPNATQSASNILITSFRCQVLLLSQYAIALLTVAAIHAAVLYLLRSVRLWDFFLLN